MSNTKPTLALLLSFITVGAIPSAGAAARGAPLLTCNKGPSGQRFNVGGTMPTSVESDSTYEIRIDGVRSGRISHFGLNYLHEMTVDYDLPPDAYVQGSARVVPNTGTANVLPSARVSEQAGILTMTLPGRVEDGGEYTPPSITVRLRANSPPGTSAVVAFRRFRLRANAIVVGDVEVSCEPAVRPSPIGSTLVVARRAAAAP